MSTLSSYRNTSPGVERFHTSTLARSAYLYIPAGADLPALDANEDTPDPLVHIKLFTPDSNWTWYLTEWDGKATAFGLVVGFETELGYVDLDELAAARGPYGLPVERDVHFRPTPLSVVRAQVEAA
jgi:hypothetical protein